MSSPAEATELKKLFNAQGEHYRPQIMGEDFEDRINATKNPEELVIAEEEREEQQKPK